MKFLGQAVLALAAGALAGPAPDPTVRPRADEVTVTLPSGTVIGSVSEIEYFKGIPYADPPVGPLRLRPPQRLSRPLGSFNATGDAASCPQMGLGAASTSKARPPQLEQPMQSWAAFHQQAEQKEDCLTITVQRPLGTRAGARLPVLFWIYGGGFVAGSTSGYDAAHMIKFAEGRQQPFVFVAVNYRVAGFGFLAGKEILADGASNLGLLDQRMGLEWVADNIEAFGGDPDKVTIWGESAGSISVFDQMLLYRGNATYKGKALFRGAIMNSGSVLPTDPVDSPKAQHIYDLVVNQTECKGQSDTLKCLRELPYEQFLNASNSVPSIFSYTSLALSYLPRPDGQVLADSPDRLASQGHFHAVPIINGIMEDEGTLFSAAQTDLNDTGALVGYLAKYFFNHATTDEITDFVNTYPPEPAAGSPFRTAWSDFNELIMYKGYMRVAAMLGDMVFTLARRLSIELMLQGHADLPVWSYLNSYLYDAPVVGTPHGADLPMMFSGTGRPATSFRTYYLNFLYSLDPDEGGTGEFPAWPRWTANKQIMWVESEKHSLLDDNFRNASYQYMKANTSKLYF